MCLQCTFPNANIAEGLILYYNNNIMYITMIYTPSGSQEIRVVYYHIIIAIKFGNIRAMWVVGM